MRTDLRRRGGQATIETMIIAGLGVVFIAVAFQLYLVNRTVTRTLNEVHSTMLSSMYKYNSDSYEYDRETVKVIWAPKFGVPSANAVPRLGMFGNDLAADLRIYSHWVEQHGDPDGTCDNASPPCKRTKAGGGLDAGSPWEVAFDGITTVGEGDYFGWLFYNGENAALDVTGVKETLQDAQAMAETLAKVKQCTDDVAGCAWDCLWGECPWD